MNIKDKPTVNKEKIMRHFEQEIDWPEGSPDEIVEYMNTLKKTYNHITDLRVESQWTEGFWLDYVEQIKDNLPVDLSLTSEHYSDMMQSYIGRVSVEEAAKRALALKLAVPATKKPKSTKKEKLYL